MKKILTRFFFLVITVLFVSTVSAQFPTIYASLGSGSWGTMATWETFTNTGNNTPGVQGTGTPAASVPSGTHFIYIRSGHIITMGGANRACYGMTIEAGGKLWAAESAARRLQLVNGGTGFLYPQSGTYTNNGTIGGFGDGIFFETGTNCQNATLTGSGVYYIRRIRMPGALGGAGGVVNLIVDQNITLDTTNNYALSAAYNSAAADNYSVTINAGKVVTIAGGSSYIHSNTATVGTYTYNINGTLDLSASIQTTQYLSALSPTGGIVNFNINGAFKTGAAFNSSPVAPGVANINVAAGAIVDATLATTMNFNGNSFTMASGTAGLQRSVPADGSKIRFPVGTANGSNTHVSVSNATGAAEVITVSIKNTFTNPAPANTLPKEWNLAEATSGGNADTLRFEWTTADEASGFSGASPVFVGHWNGSAWAFVAASVSGTGTSLDPYVAKASGVFSTLGLFILSNTGTTPVSFINVKAFQKQNGIQVEFGNATETDIVNYVIERSADGRSFNTAGTLLPKTNNGALNSYSYFDATTNSGNNFYRIKVTERNGSVKYSNILNVRLSGNSGVTVYPNPVKGHTVNVQLENLDKAIYVVTVFNEVGQTVYTKQLNHDGRTASFAVELPSSLKRGIYNLQVSNNGFRAIKNVVVE